MSDANTALPWNCSGAIYGGLPMTVVPCAAISRKREVPKSATLRSASLGDEHVAGSQIAVDHAVLMCVIDCVADLAGVVEASARSRAPSRAMTFERVAWHVLHDDEEDVLLLLRGQDRDDVGMVQAKRAAGAPAAARRNRGPADAPPLIAKLSPSTG